MNSRFFYSIQFCVFLFITGYSSAQKYNITESEAFFNKGSTTIHKIFGHDSAFFYEFKKNGIEHIIQKYDYDLNLVGEETIILHKGLRSYNMEAIVHFHDKLYVFATIQKFNHITLYYRTLSKDSLIAKDEFEELITIKNIKGNWADFHFTLSREQKKLLIACRIKLNWSNKQYNEFYVYDADLEPVWVKKDFYEFKGQGPRQNKYVVDETGNVSILSLIKQESILQLFSEEKNLYWIYRYTDQGNNYKEYPVTFTEKYIRGIDITPGLHGDLICVGLYSNMFRDGIKGTFFFRIDTLNERVTNYLIRPFESDFIRTLYEAEEPLIAADELMQYELSDLIIRPNGKIVMISEQFFEQNYDTYNNLIITCFDENGDVYWNQFIRKRQDFNIRHLDDGELELSQYRDYLIQSGAVNLSNTNFSSYGLMAPLHENYIVIFYNDHRKNLDQSEKVYNFNNPRRSYLAAVSIDEFGNLDKEDLVHWKRREPFPEVLKLYDNLNSSVIIPMVKGRKYKYLLVERK